MLYLEHESIDQTQISPRNAYNCCDSLFVSEIIGMRLDSMTPSLPLAILPKMYFWQALTSNLYFRQRYEGEREKYAAYKLYKLSL